LLYYFLTGKLLINLQPLPFRNCLSPPSCRRTKQKYAKEICERNSPLCGPLDIFLPLPHPKNSVLFHFSHFLYSTLHRTSLPPTFHFTATKNEYPTHKLTLSVGHILLFHLLSISLRVSSVFFPCRL